MIKHQERAQWATGFREDGFSILSMCSVNDQIKMHERAFLTVTLNLHMGLHPGPLCLKKGRKADQSKTTTTTQKCFGFSDFLCVN